MTCSRAKAILTIVSLAGLAACKAGEQAPGGGPPPASEVSVVTVRAEPIAIADELPGRVAAFRVAEVRPQVGGIVRQRTFTEGDTVRAGAPLYRIDQAPFRAEVAGASATLDRGNAALAQAELNATRARSLFETGSVSRQTVDDAEASLALARAELGQARAALQRNRLNLRFATITAPIDGQIGISRISEGALVSPTDPAPLAVIQQIDRVYVDIRQPAERAEQVRAALEHGELERSGAAEVTILTSTGEAYPERGRVLFSDISVDPGTGELTLRALVPNTQRRLLPGMYVRARITRGEDPSAIAVPQQAVMREPTGGTQVLVVGRDNKAVARSVDTGRITNGRYVITRGLSPGDRVVVEGQDRIQPGTVVRPSPWQQTASDEAPR